MNSRSLWPEDLFSKKLVAPVQILKEQAKFLGIASQRTILAKVVTGREQQSGYGYGYSSHENAAVLHTFQLEVPGLGDYTFDLFQISHQPRALYPVFLEYFLDNQEEPVRIDDEDGFRHVVEKILSSPETVSVVRTLKAQIEDPGTLPPEVEEEAPSQATASSDDDDIPF